MIKIVYIKRTTANDATIFRKGRNESKLKIFILCGLCVFFVNFAVKNFLSCT
jgi:hypothetical protein